MNDIKWRFPSNSYASVTGLDTADLETFKKDAISSLAREIAQNSIDARRKELNKPVRVEFKKFEILKNDIPGFKEINEEIDNCLDYWKEAHSKKIVDGLDLIKKEINRDKITCLRISDFNTTGLIGISKDKNSPWQNLIHGSGVSEKGLTSGGSKGIGKNASFVNSHFRTVFYSTKTIDGEVGFEGICKLCSGKIKGSDQITQGIGYYGLSEKNKPVLKEISLDKNYIRKDNDYGTDIYILGFKNEAKWKKEIVIKILESFMSAIIFEMLEVVVDDIVINKKTLRDIVYNENIVSTKQEKQYIYSQYILLTNESVYKENIIVEDLGQATLYLKVFDGDLEEYAINKCIMIRYPYMKIKDKSIQSLVKVSALCLIPDNELNSMLREVENPQHTDWEIKRIEDIDIRDDFKNKIEFLYKKINEIISKHTLRESSKEIEIEGGEIIALNNSDGDLNGEKKKISSKANISNLHRPKINDSKGYIEDIDANNIQKDFGELDNASKQELSIPLMNDSSRGEGMHAGSDTKNGTVSEDGKDIFKRVELRSLKYHFFCINKNEKKYAVSFTSHLDEENVQVLISGLGESNDEIDLGISNCKVNGINTDIKDNVIDLSLKKGCKYKIEFTTSQSELFACWVRSYAYKK